jgi:hypothetical protein
MILLATQGCFFAQRAMEQQQFEADERQRELVRAQEQAEFEQRERERLAVEKRLQEAEERKRQRQASKEGTQAETPVAASVKSPRSNVKSPRSASTTRTPATVLVASLDGSRQATPNANSTLTPETMPLCAKLLELSKGRASEPAYKYYVGGEWVGVTWEQYAAQVSSAARALIALGVKRGERVLLVRDTRPEWSVMSLATQLIGGVSVAAYPSSPVESLLAIMAEQLPLVLVTDDAQQLLKMEARMAHVKHIVTVNFESADRRALQWASFIAAGRDVKVRSRICIVALRS